MDGGNKSFARVVLAMMTAALMALSVPALAHHRPDHQGGPRPTESTSPSPIETSPTATTSPSASPIATVPPVPPIPPIPRPSPDAGCVVDALGNSLPIGGDPPMSSLKPFAPLNVITAVFCLL